MWMLKGRLQRFISGVHILKHLSPFWIINKQDKQCGTWFQSIVLQTILFVLDFQSLLFLFFHKSVWKAENAYLRLAIRNCFSTRAIELMWLKAANSDSQNSTTAALGLTLIPRKLYNLWNQSLVMQSRLPFGEGCFLGANKTATKLL